MLAERNAWGFSLFCDDFRQEIGGKSSLMGLYQNEMVFPTQASFPILLPRFVVFVKYFELKGTFTEDLHLKVFFPGDETDKPTFAQHISRSTFQNIKPTEPPDDDTETLIGLTAPLIFSPFQAAKGGHVSVRMQCGDITTRLGRLLIRTVRPDEQIQFP